MSRSAATAPVEGAAAPLPTPLRRIRQAFPGLSGTLRASAEYILAHYQELRRLSIYELAAQAGVSTHAVSRLGVQR